MNQNPLVLNNGLPITTALSASGPLNYAQAYFSQSSSWTTTNNTYTDGTNSGGNSLTIRQSSGITLTAAASNICGITFTPTTSTAVYMIWAQVGMGGTGDSYLGARMYDGTTVISAPASSVNATNVFNGDLNVVTLGGIYAPATTSAVTVKIQISGTGTTTIENLDATNGNCVEWTIVELSSNGGNNGVTAWDTNLSVTPSGAFGSYSGLVTQSRIVGNNLECKVYMTAGTNSGTIMSLALPSGYIIDSSKLNSIGSFLNGNATSLSSPGNVILATSEFQSYPFYDGSDTANIYFTASTQSGAFVKQIGTNFVDSDTPWLCEFSVPIVGLFASSSINGTYANGGTSSAGSWATTSTSFIDPTNSGGNTYTPNLIGGLTVSGETLSGNNLPAIVFTPDNSKAAYKITATTSCTSNGSNKFIAFQLIDNNNNIVGYASYQNGLGITGSVIPIVIDGISASGSTSPTTIRIQMATNGTVATFGDFTGGLVPSIFWNIEKIA